MYLSVLHRQAAAPPVRKPYAHAGVLHGTGNARSRMILINLFHRLQCFHQRGARKCNLSVWQHLPRTDGVAIANLPRGNAHRCKTALRHTESPERACGRIIGVNRFSVNVYILIIIWPGRMGTESLKHRSTQGCIGAGIRHHHRLHA